MKDVKSVTIRGEKVTQLKELAKLNDIPAAVIARKLTTALLYGTKKLKAADLQAALGLTEIKIFHPIDDPPTVV